MSAFVVDASVAVKWFVPEIDSDAAAALLTDEHGLHVPDLLFPEFGNILWKKVSRRELTRGEALAALTGLQAVPLQVHRTKSLLETALHLAFDTGRTVYDCLYLALALVLDCRTITADTRLYNSLQATPYAIHVMRTRDAGADQI